MVAITARTMADEIRRQQKLSTSITDLQAAISSGTKLTKSSQDPQAWVQISEIGRAQAQQWAWATNIAYAQSRSEKAETNLNDMSTLLTRAHELMVTAKNGTLDDANRAAISTELQGIRTSINDLLSEKDYLGVSIFDQGAATMIPVGKNYSVDAVPTQEALAQNINVKGTAMSLDDILSQAISAVSSGDTYTIGSAMDGTSAAGDHITLALTMQGVRSNRLDKASSRIDAVSLDLTNRRSKLEDTDLSTAIITLLSKITSLSAAQATYAQINQGTLFDYIK